MAYILDFSRDYDKYIDDKIYDDFGEVDIFNKNILEMDLANILNMLFQFVVVEELDLSNIKNNMVYSMRNHANKIYKIMNLKK